MQAVILAGGRGTRLHPVNTAVPKAMLPLFDRPVLEHMIGLLARHGIEDIIVAVSHEAMELPHYFGDGRRLGARIRYSVEAEPLGTAGALRSVQEMIGGAFLVVPGDAITDFDLSAALAAHSSTSAVATVLLHEADDPTAYSCVAVDEQNRIARYAHKPASNAVFGNTIATGICIFERDALSSIPPFESRDISLDLIPRLVHNGEPIYGCRAPGYWCDSGHLLAYRGAHFDALKGLLKLDLPATHLGDGIWLGDRVQVHPTVDIAGPVYLGTGVVVRRDVVLGQSTVIGEDVLIEEGARISRSIIGSRCHVGREAVVSDCVIGAGYVAPDGENVTERTILAHMEYAVAQPERALPKPTDSSPAEVAYELNSAA